ncbi:MAG: DNA ligase D [Sandaracinaceae bacterium]
MRRLDEYEDKRDFDRTPEPGTGAAAAEGGRRFVVQKHDATRLHYDFRLEHDGVLWSWAVPKGPSVDPSDKRLAVRTEDHPLAYAAFEGVIPEGEYGGGPVAIWDRGTWTPLGDPDAMMEKGHLRFELDGERLHGRWSLVETKRDWLLIKSRDAHAEPGGPSIVDRHLESVVSRRTTDAIASGAGVVDPSTIAGARAEEHIDPEPQLATPAERPPRGEGWIHELKLDGYRILAHVRAPGAIIRTRHGLDWSHKLPSIVQALGHLPVDEAWVDGELVVLGEGGVPDFGALQRAVADGRDASVRLFLFDLLYLDGYDLRSAPLRARRDVLRALLPESDDGPLRFSEGFDDGEALLREVRALGGEGVVSKRGEGTYVGRRTQDWRKIRCNDRFVRTVVGFTPAKGARKGLGALVLGRDQEGALHYAGKVGTGFDAETLLALAERLEPMRTDRSPLVDPPSLRGVRWVRPELRARVRAVEETREGRLRQPVFEAIEASDAGEARAEPAPSRTKLTSPGRILFGTAKLTKKDLADYFDAVSSRMLPLVCDRPLMLLRTPKGVAGDRFYQKHFKAGASDALRAVDVGDGEPHIAIDDRAGLRALAQISAVEIHVWGARASDLERPERVVLDLDPDPDLPWDAVATAAEAVRELLEGVGLHAFCLSTGGKGVHVVAPLVPRAGWSEVKAFCRAVAESLEESDPGRYTSVMTKSERTGRVFVDYLRNGRGATAIAPFSTRASPRATVATPIAWADLRLAGPRTVLDVLEALDADDPWGGYEDARRPLPS